jgi:hypothetical protein
MAAYVQKAGKQLSPELLEKTPPCGNRHFDCLARKFKHCHKHFICPTGLERLLQVMVPKNLAADASVPSLFSYFFIGCWGKMAATCKWRMSLPYCSGRLA